MPRGDHLIHKMSIHFTSKANSRLCSNDVYVNGIFANILITASVLVLSLLSFLAPVRPLSWLIKKGEFQELR